MLKLTIKHKETKVFFQTDERFKSYVDLRTTVLAVIEKSINKIDEEN